MSQGVLFYACLCVRAMQWVVDNMYIIIVIIIITIIIKTSVLCLLEWVSQSIQW